MGELSKILLKGVEQNRGGGGGGGGHKNFKKGGKVGQGVGASKKGRLESPYKL